MGGMIFHIVNIAFSLIIPVGLVWNLVKNPVVGFLLLLTSLAFWMKLVSYVHANEDYRNYPERNSSLGIAMVRKSEGDEVEVRYPRNITLSNIYYFMAAPTLTYQIAFPRLPSINYL